MWQVEFFYDNPKRNFSQTFDTYEEAIEAVGGRSDVVSWITNTTTGESWRHEAN